jgi:diguanylate cyclase
MKHSQERKASEEILRLAIQRMAAHPAAFIPCTYAVWYEYIMGVNPGLNAEMNQLLQSRIQLDDATITRLFQSHVPSFRGEASRKIREGMQVMLGRLIDVTEESNKHTQSFGDSLLTFGSKLHSNLDPDTLGNLATKMANDTEFMRDSVNSLYSELKTSKEEVVRLQAELESARQEALIDPLTGVYNRRGFEIQVKSLLADGARTGAGACLLLLDIDRFKTINDTYGHIFGDKVIRTLASTLKFIVKGQDSVCRMGGEEFAILLPQTELSGAEKVAEHIRKSIETGKIKSPISDVQIDSVTVSIGIAVHVAGDNMMKWLDQADKALYISKQGGRNKVTVYRE